MSRVDMQTVNYIAQVNKTARISIVFCHWVRMRLNCGKWLFLLVIYVLLFSWILLFAAFECVCRFRVYLAGEFSRGRPLENYIFARTIDCLSCQPRYYQNTVIFPFDTFELLLGVNLWKTKYQIAIGVGHRWWYYMVSTELTGCAWSACN